MKYKTITIQMCDQCGEDLPINFIDCYTFSVYNQKEHPHNGDLYESDDLLLQFCKKCGVDTYNKLIRKI